MQEQQTISLPWIIANKKLLVSVPEGKVLDFPIGDTSEKDLLEVFDSTSFWTLFFYSLVASLNVQK